MVECPIVDTCYGQVIGRVCTSQWLPTNAKTVFDYQGIPFAKPPIDDLRFEPPQK